MGKSLQWIGSQQRRAIYTVEALRSMLHLIKHAEMRKWGECSQTKSTRAGENDWRTNYCPQVKAENLS